MDSVSAREGNGPEVKDEREELGKHTKQDQTDAQ